MSKIYHARWCSTPSDPLICPPFLVMYLVWISLLFLGPGYPLIRDLCDKVGNSLEVTLL
jgi:hypothetical protein